MMMRYYIELDCLLFLLKFKCFLMFLKNLRKYNFMMFDYTSNA